jgi:hypothetical protein
VSLQDTIEFLRENGMDRLADGYGLHVYLDADPHRSVAMRIASLEAEPFCPMHANQAVLADGMGNR